MESIPKYLLQGILERLEEALYVKYWDRVSWHTYSVAIIALNPSKSSLETVLQL